MPFADGIGADTWWVKQQGRTYEAIQAQWYHRSYWTGFQGQVEAIDALIEEFNARVGLL